MKKINLVLLLTVLATVATAQDSNEPYMVNPFDVYRTCSCEEYPFDSKIRVKIHETYEEHDAIPITKALKLPATWVHNKEFDDYLLKQPFDDKINTSLNFDIKFGYCFSGVGPFIILKTYCTSNAWYNSRETYLVINNDLEKKIWLEWREYERLGVFTPKVLTYMASYGVASARKSQIFRLNEVSNRYEKITSAYILYSIATDDKKFILSPAHIQSLNELLKIDQRDKYLRRNVIDSCHLTDSICEVMAAQKKDSLKKIREEKIALHTELMRKCDSISVHTLINMSNPIISLIDTFNFYNNSSYTFEEYSLTDNDYYKYAWDYVRNKIQHIHNDTLPTNKVFLEYIEDMENIHYDGKKEYENQVYKHIDTTHINNMIYAFVKATNFVYIMHGIQKFMPHEQYKKIKIPRQIKTKGGGVWGDGPVPIDSTAKIAVNYTRLKGIDSKDETEQKEYSTPVTNMSQEQLVKIYDYLYEIFKNK
jgi:hypothetical protein